MEEKNQSGQSGTESNNTSNDNASQPAGNSNAAGDMANKLIEDVKKFNMMSLIGLGMAILFLLFMFFNGVKFKWWLMLPLAGASAFILYRQLADTQGFEKKACKYTLIALGVLFLLRDIQASRNVDYMLNAASRIKAALGNIKIKTPTGVKLPTPK